MDFNKLINDIKQLNTRLDWDEYFIVTSFLISKRSSCDRLNVGCVITKDKRIISTGYNGHIPGTPHESIIVNNHEQMTIHAEVNAICHAAKTGTSLNDCIVYITHFPCINCTKSLIASGVKKIVYGEDYKNNKIVYKLLQSKDIEIVKMKIED
ncbi:MAG: dCMP deaminase [Magnetococcales bacterium]|nr:dCMP deaminase [Magnetococcales bacterium]|tara:strand:+ start:12039 stop:12497 length:459 start_codon:yes stop_codon:yes gene_type:complete